MVMDKLRGSIAINIMAHGQHLMMVGGNPPFIYTIGNHLHNLPELLVIGCPMSMGHVVNLLCDRMRTQGTPFDNGGLVDIGGKVPLKIINAHPVVKDEYTIQAGQYFGTEDYAVQQILIPDLEGRYPGEAGCAKPYRLIPVFAA